MRPFNNGGVKTWNVWCVRLIVLIHLWLGSESFPNSSSSFTPAVYRSSEPSSETRPHSSCSLPTPISVLFLRSNN